MAASQAPSLPRYDVVREDAGILVATRNYKWSVRIRADGPRDDAELQVRGRPSIRSIRIRHLVAVIAVNSNEVVGAPWIKVLSYVGHSRPNSRSRACGVLHVGWRNKNDLARIDRRGTSARSCCSCASAKLPKQGLVCSWIPSRTECHVSRAGNRILSILHVKRIYRVNDLGEIVFDLRLFGLVLNCFESRKEQADQNGDDCDDDQQLDESEGLFVLLERTHGANASRDLSSAHVKLFKKVTFLQRLQRFFATAPHFATL
jgi:hypothetical protein